MDQQQYTMPVEPLIARSLSNYLSDLHAIETNMCECFEKMHVITKNLHDTHLVVLSSWETSKRHMKILEGVIKRLGEVEKPIADKLISIFAGLVGYASGLFDNMNQLPLSKIMCDAQATIHHAVARYVMLITVSTAMDNHEASVIARVFMNDWTKISLALMSIIPGLTMNDLRDQGMPILDSEAAMKVKKDEAISYLFSNEELKPEVKTEPQRAIPSAFAVL